MKDYIQRIQKLHTKDSKTTYKGLIQRLHTKGSKTTYKGLIQRLHTKDSKTTYKGSIQRLHTKDSKTTYKGLKDYIQRIDSKTTYRGFKDNIRSIQRLHTKVPVCSKEASEGRLLAGSMRTTGLKISACLLLIVLKALCLCFLTQTSAAFDAGTSEETSVSSTPNSTTIHVGTNEETSVSSTPNSTAIHAGTSEETSVSYTPNSTAIHVGTSEETSVSYTPNSTAIHVGTSGETSVSYTPNFGSSQDGHGTTLAGRQNNGANNSPNIVDVIDLCPYSIPPAFIRIKNHFVRTVDNKICRGNPMELIQGNTGFKSVNTIVTTKMTAKVKRYFRLSSITKRKRKEKKEREKKKKALMPYYK